MYHHFVILCNTLRALTAANNITHATTTQHALQHTSHYRVITAVATPSAAAAASTTVGSYSAYITKVSEGKGTHFAEHITSLEMHTSVMLGPSKY